jgi:hypothetical protein
MPARAVGRPAAFGAGRASGVGSSEAALRELRENGLAGRRSAALAQPSPSTDAGPPPPAPLFAFWQGVSAIVAREYVRSWLTR